MKRFLAYLGFVLALLSPLTLRATVVVNYNFNGDAAGTLLESCTVETGGAWVKHPNFASSSIKTDNAGRIMGAFAGTSVYYDNTTFSSADYDVEGDITPLDTTATSVGIMGRMSTSATTYYLFDYQTSTGQFFLFTVVGGATQNTTSFTQALTTSTTYHMRLSMRGSRIQCFVNGSLVIQIVDTNISTAGTCGILYGQNLSNTTGIHLDNVVASTPSSTTAVTDASIFFSPYNWYSDGGGSLSTNNVKGSSTYALSCNPGSYVRVSLNATSGGYYSLLIDATLLNGVTAANCPTITVSLDGGALTSTLLAYNASATTNRVLLGGNLSSGVHTATVCFQSVNLSATNAMGDRWTAPKTTAPAGVLKITGVEMDGKGSSTNSITPATENWIFFGDSMGEGADVNGSSLTDANNDATLAFPHLIGTARGAEFGNVCWSGQGWASSYSFGNVPKIYDTTTPANNTWNQYFSGASRLTSGALSPAPTFAFVRLGRNDSALAASDASVTASVTAFLTDFTAAAPKAKIFIAIPYGGEKRTAIQAGVQAFGGANVVIIDQGTANQTAATALYSNDAIHPSARGHAILAATDLNLMGPTLAAIPTNSGVHVGN